MIRYENGIYHYFDRNSIELHDGEVVQYESGSRQKLYLTENGRLGTDATNPVWIANGRAVPCEYGIYPLEEAETEESSTKQTQKSFSTIAGLLIPALSAVFPNRTCRSVSLDLAIVIMMVFSHRSVLFPCKSIRMRFWLLSVKYLCFQS